MLLGLGGHSFNGTARVGIPVAAGWGYPSGVAAYEYVCMACEHRFEERRPMTASVDTMVTCPSCGGDRARRQYSFAAGTASGTDASASGGGGGCGCGTCSCGG